MIPVVHQLADRSGPPSHPIIRTKCGLIIDRRKDKHTRYSGFDSEITCTLCEPAKAST